MVISARILLLLATVIGTISATILVRDYIIPRSAGNRSRLLRSLVLLHSFRFVGLGMFLSGVSAKELPLEFIIPVAWGDYITAVLSVLSYLLLARKSRLAIGSVWVFNIWGFLDLLYAGFLAAKLQISDYIGVIFFVFTLYAPLLVVSHIVVFKLLIRNITRDAELRS